MSESEKWPFVVLVIAMFLFFICCMGGILRLRGTFRKTRKSSHTHYAFRPAETTSPKDTVIDMQNLNLSEAKSEVVNKQSVVDGN